MKDHKFKKGITAEDLKNNFETEVKCKELESIFDKLVKQFGYFEYIDPVKLKAFTNKLPSTMKEQLIKDLKDNNYLIDNKSVIIGDVIKYNNVYYLFVDCPRDDLVELIDLKAGISVDTKDVDEFHTNDEAVRKMLKITDKKPLELYTISTYKKKG